MGNTNIIGVYASHCVNRVFLALVAEFVTDFNVIRSNHLFSGCRLINGHAFGRKILALVNHGRELLCNVRPCEFEFFTCFQSKHDTLRIMVNKTDLTVTAVTADTVMLFQKVSKFLVCRLMLLIECRDGLLAMLKAGASHEFIVQSRKTVHTANKQACFVLLLFRSISFLRLFGYKRFGITKQSKLFSLIVISKRLKAEIICFAVSLDLLHNRFIGKQRRIIINRRLIGRSMIRNALICSFRDSFFLVSEVHQIAKIKAFQCREHFIKRTEVLRYRLIPVIFLNNAELFKVSIDLNREHGFLVRCVGKVNVCQI